MERIDDLNINGKKIIQDTDLFLFGMDSVLLANMVKKTTSKTNIVDLGTGACVIPILLTQKVKCNKIIGIELQTKMYDLAKRNIELNDAKDKVEVLNLDIKEIKRIREKIISITGEDSVNIVISNPPYKKIGTGVPNDLSEKGIARHEVMCTLEDIFKTASSILKFKGRLYLVHKPERIADLITVARKYNLELKNLTFMQPTIDKKPSIVLLEYVLGGGNECVVSKTIIEYDESGNYTKDILDIYNMEEDNE